MFLKIKKIILDILFPVRCFYCKKSGIWLCDECYHKIPVEEFFYCPVCGRKSLRGEAHQLCAKKSFLDGLLIASQWQNEILHQAIHKFKYKFIQDLKVPLGKILVKKIYQADGFFEPTLSQGYFDYLIPVPLFKRRELWRGFNQAELLASEVAREIHLPIFQHAISRIRQTTPQVGKKQKRRWKNLCGAFQVNSEFINQLRGKKILIIDDVVTTGSTIQEVAKVLKLAGTREAWGLALARG